MLVRVAQIRVVVDDDHQPATVVPNSLTLRHEAILFPRDPAIVSVRQARNLDDLLDIVKLMKDSVIAWDVLDLGIWKNFSQLAFHRLPFEAAPKIIQNPEPTSIEIFAHDCGSLVGEYHLFGLARINEGIAEQIRIVDRNRSFMVRNIEIRQPLETRD